MKSQLLNKNIEDIYADIDKYPLLDEGTFKQCWEVSDEFVLLTFDSNYDYECLWYIHIIESGLLTGEVFHIDGFTLLIVEKLQPCLELPNYPLANIEVWLSRTFRPVIIRLDGKVLEVFNSFISKIMEIPNFEALLVDGKKANNFCMNALGEIIPVDLFHVIRSTR